MKNYRLKELDKLASEIFLLSLDSVNSITIPEMDAISKVSNKIASVKEGAEFKLKEEEYGLVYSVLLSTKFSKLEKELIELAEKINKELISQK